MELQPIDPNPNIPMIVNGATHTVWHAYMIAILSFLFAVCVHLAYIYVVDKNLVFTIFSIIVSIYTICTFIVAYQAKRDHKDVDPFKRSLMCAFSFILFYIGITILIVTNTEFYNIINALPTSVFLCWIAFILSSLALIFFILWSLMMDFSQYNFTGYELDLLKSNLMAHKAELNLLQKRMVDMNEAEKRKHDEKKLEDQIEKMASEKMRILLNQMSNGKDASAPPLFPI